jgi:phosphohistidine phosphatase
MKRLTLFRHAKSGWDDPVARDFDRPLNRRGQRAAILMGQFAKSQKMVFDHLVASPAVRVIDTIDGFLEGYGQSLEPQWDRRIYLASAGTLTDVIRDIPDSADSAMMVGHNPGFEDLILTLVPEDGTSPLRDSVEVKFPTASIAVLEAATDHWDDIERAPITLVSFTRPRDLDPTLGPEH